MEWNGILQPGHCAAAPFTVAITAFLFYLAITIFYTFVALVSR